MFYEFPIFSLKLLSPSLLPPPSVVCPLPSVKFISSVDLIKN